MKVVIEIKKQSKGFKVAVDSDSGRKPRVYRSYPTTLANLIICVISAVCETFRYE